MARSINASAVMQEFLQQANEAQQHMGQLAARTVQLKGTPNFNSEGLLTRSHAGYVEG